ncbi:hypothetical protein DFA_04093 [Cavenderia fasciculata]|uniref:Ubiquitin-like domain-containing protein n=1 Tax=Cavenderia fasciculata TaxID=261658 RepID=F4Q198_CACFS|nr:uncharacterized protein DFA_04093 [Cavenderia fasciculata]EGG18599.1 hypothetical protein DFA_04093 [Cavenderia fasciculata]|eukprot:XP_004366503.1 hypothetical protein DFA_04093 [Cavenderia fasciculata]
MSDININVKQLDGKVYTLKVTLATKVPELKEQLHELSGINTALQRLIYKGKVLRDDKDLDFYKIEDGVTLHLTERPPEPAPGTSTTSTSTTSTSSTSPQVHIHHGLPQIIPGAPNGNSIPPNSRVFIQGAGDNPDILQNVLRQLGGANRVVIAPNNPGTPAPTASMFENQIRNSLNSINDPALDPNRVPQNIPANPLDSRPALQRLITNLELAQTQINQLLERTNQLAQALPNESTMTEPQQRQDLQQQVAQLGQGYQRLGQAGNHFSQYLSSFVVGQVPGQTHFSVQVSQVSQISFEYPNGMNINNNNGGEMNVNNGAAVPNIGVTTTHASPVPGGQTDPSNIFQMVFQSLQGQQPGAAGAPAAGGQQQQQQAGQQQANNPMGGLQNILQGVLGPALNAAGQQIAQQQQQQGQGGQQPAAAGGQQQANPLAALFGQLGGQQQPGQQQPGQQQQQANPLAGLQTMLQGILNPQANASGQPQANPLAALFGQLGGQQQQDQDENGDDAFSDFMSHLPMMMIDFRFLYSGVPSQVVQGHRNIRRIIETNMLDGDTSDSNVEEFIAQFSEGLAPALQQHALTPDMVSRVLPGHDLIGRVLRVVRSNMRRLFGFILTEPGESNPIAELTTTWTRDFIVALVDEIATCMQGGSEDAFIIINRFLQQTIAGSNPLFGSFITPVTHYIRSTYEANRPLRNNTNNTNNTNNNNNNNSSTTSTSTSTTSTTTTTPSTTTTTSTVNNNQNTNNININIPIDGTIPQEWAETIEVDQARQESMPPSVARAPLTTNYTNPTKLKKQKLSTSPSSAASTSLFGERLVQATRDTPNVNTQGLLAKAESENLVEMYQQLIDKSKTKQ